MVEVSGGASKHIAQDLKPEARKASSEEEAWEAVDKILQMKVESYPENFSRSYSVIRKFHQLRWEMRARLGTMGEMKNEEMRTRLNKLMEEYPGEVLDQAKDIFGIIIQIYSK